MTIDSGHADTDAVAVAALGARRLTRGVAATWWYTAVAIAVFEVILVFVWADTLVDTGLGHHTISIVGIGGMIWWVSTFLLLLEYRRATRESPLARWTVALVPLLAAVSYGIAAGLSSGLWALGLLPIVQSIVLLNWEPGARIRVVFAATLLLTVLCIIDARVILTESGEPIGGDSWTIVSFYSILLPLMTVLSLWWWDVLMALNRARASEAHLAATQERLRVATDVHDLQGHHLQVIALQLELAERLIVRDPKGAQQQLRASRVSVDEARQGTRDLAARFRSVPLGDELANAADLLRAAGTTTNVFVDLNAGRAPAEVLGPVIRETTTNVLRHGGGTWARLALVQVGSAWTYEISNDLAIGATFSNGGSGLDGLKRRASEAGGTLEMSDAGQCFRITMTVPDQVVAV